jgi:peroxiredoxin Q/BCP
MKLQPNQTAPDFSIQDVRGKTVKLSDYKGKKILLALNRFAGCPICNMNFHEVQKNADYFKSKGMVILSVHESNQKVMQDFIKDETIYGTMIPDADGKIYSLYGSDRSFGKFLSGMLLHGTLGKALSGSKLFKNKVSTEGHKDRVGADFLIDENGKIATAYYGNYVGDRLPIEQIKAFAGGN